MKILVIEDDLVLARELTLLCGKWGYTAAYAENFKEIIKEYEVSQPDLILMDINLPFYDGFYWCEKIREVTTVPILFLSSREQNADKVMGMAVGGDDYMEKPFDSELLLVKIRSLLRRTYEYKSNHREYLMEGIYYEPGKVVSPVQAVELTRSESKVMSALIENRGRVVSRDQLMQILWNTDEFVTDASLTVLISRLRSKLREGSGDRDVVCTKKGMGYYIE